MFKEQQSGTKMVLARGWGGSRTCVPQRTSPSLSHPAFLSVKCRVVRTKITPIKCTAPHLTGRLGGSCQNPAKSPLPLLCCHNQVSSSLVLRTHSPTCWEARDVAEPGGKHLGLAFCRSQDSRHQLSPTECLLSTAPGIYVALESVAQNPQALGITPCSVACRTQCEMKPQSLLSINSE